MIQLNDLNIQIILRMSSVTLMEIIINKMQDPPENMSGTLEEG